MKILTQKMIKSQIMTTTTMLVRLASLLCIIKVLENNSYFAMCSFIVYDFIIGKMVCHLSKTILQLDYDH